ncbi:MAG: hypothetical protein ACRDVP_03695 [Acidimicrobiales bacterium]
MPRSSTGKWVSRVGATGGGRRYHGQRPVNWYAALVLIVLVGLASVAFSRYEYTHAKTLAVQPAVGTTSYAGYAIDICGKLLPALPVSTNASTAGVSTPGSGVLNVSPKTPAQAGNHATLGLFFSQYHGIALSADSITVLPTKTYKNGDSCPAGTPFGGQKGVVKAQYWPNLLAKSPVPVNGSPADYKIGSRTLVTVGFVPSSSPLKRPPTSTIDAMLEFASSVQGGVTTTAPPATTTPSSSVPSTSTPSSGPTAPTTAPQSKKK